MLKRTRIGLAIRRLIMHRIGKKRNRSSKILHFDLAVSIERLSLQFAVFHCSICVHCIAPCGHRSRRANIKSIFAIGRYRVIG